MRLGLGIWRWRGLWLGCSLGLAVPTVFGCSQAYRDPDPEGTPGGGDVADGGVGGEEDPGTDDPANACVSRRLLVYALQPAGSSAPYEAQFSELVPVMSAMGFDVTFENRAGTPLLTFEHLSSFDIVLFGSGCGGETGLPSADELDALRRFYLAGGSFVVVTDDAIGDSSAPGSCHARVNPIVGPVGVFFSGTVDHTALGCAPVQSTHPVLQGLTLGRFTSADVTLLGSVSWGTDLPVLIGTLADGSPAEVLVERTEAHGAVLLSNDFGSMSCDGPRYLGNIIRSLGCKAPPLE